MIQVLIIEDEPLIALSIKNTIEKKGFVVVGCAGNFSEAYELFIQKIPDIILSDIKLENNESGIEVVAKLQELGTFLLIYLTSYGDEMMMEKALKTQPISYLTKPFKESDLSAVLKIATQKLELNTQVIDNNLIYNRFTKTLFYQGIQVILSKQEADLFHACYLNSGNFVPMSSIEELIWNYESVSNSTKRGLFHRLRKKIGENIFEYVRGVGCRLKI